MGKSGKREGFLLGALMLSFSGLLVKISGLIFRVGITGLVDQNDAAMSHFSAAYSVYTFLLSLSTSGIPIAISAMVSKSLALGKYKDVKHLIKYVTVIFVAFGAAVSALGMIFARPIAQFINNDDSYYCMFLIMPSVFFISVVSVYRGFFQGYNNMKPTSVSNLIDAAVKLVAGVGLAAYLQKIGQPPHIVVAGAIAGVSLGALGSCLYMFLRYIFRNKDYRISVRQFMSDEGTPTKSLMKEFMMIALPVALSSITVQLMGLIDTTVIINRLKTFMTEVEAQAAYGAYSTKATTIFNLPSFFIITIGVSLVPSISAAFAKKDSVLVKRTGNLALKYSAIIAFACALGLSAVSQPTIQLIFSGSTPLAGELLSILSLSLVAVGFTNVTTYMLQAIGKAYQTVISTVIGVILKSLLTFLLLEPFGIYGAPIATNIAYPVMFIINLLYIKKYLGFVPNFVDILVKPLFAGIACWAAAWGTLKLFDMWNISQKIALFPAIILGAIVYIALLFALKLVTINEIKQVMKKK